METKAYAPKWTFKVKTFNIADGSKKRRKDSEERKEYHKLRERQRQNGITKQIHELSRRAPFPFTQESETKAKKLGRVSRYICYLEQIITGVGVELGINLQFLEALFMTPKLSPEQRIDFGLDVICDQNIYDVICNQGENTGAELIQKEFTPQYISPRITGQYTPLPRITGQYTPLPGPYTPLPSNPYTRVQGRKCCKKYPLRIKPSYKCRSRSAKLPYRNPTYPREYDLLEDYSKYIGAEDLQNSHVSPEEPHFSAQGHGDREMANKQVSKPNSKVNGSDKIPQPNSGTSSGLFDHDLGLNMTTSDQEVQNAIDNLLLNEGCTVNDLSWPGTEAAVEGNDMINGLLTHEEMDQMLDSLSLPSSQARSDGTDVSQVTMQLLDMDNDKSKELHTPRRSKRIIKIPTGSPYSMVSKIIEKTNNEREIVHGPLPNQLSDGDRQQPEVESQELELSCPGPQSNNFPVEACSKSDCEEASSQPIELTLFKLTPSSHPQTLASVCSTHMFESKLFTDFKELSRRKKKIDARCFTWMNGYMMYNFLNRKKFIQENPGMHTAVVSRLIGKRWRTLTSEEKLPYKECADYIKQHLKPFYQAVNKDKPEAPMEAIKVH